MVCAKSVKLTNVPNITDIHSLLNILKKIGSNVVFKNNTLKIKHNINNQTLLFDEIRKFRASYYLMSVYLALFNEVQIYYPGGCSIGSRPIDFHLEGFMKAGCVVKQDENIVSIKCSRLKPFIYKIPKKSMGATVNLLILASKINGLSVIKNASTEPEIDDLISFVNKGGAFVYRKGGDIFVNGSGVVVDKIKHKIIPDRIECFTYMCVGAYSEKLRIKNINISHLKMPIYYLNKANVIFIVKRKSIVVKKSKLKGITVSSGDYPSLSTDQMPLMYPLFTRIDDVSKFTEGIFENRFSVCEELKKTNANISIDKNSVIINGKDDIIGSDLYATDLRGAASLLIEGIINQNSTVYNLEYLERGYNDIYKNLKKIRLNFKIEE